MNEGKSTLATSVAGLEARFAAAYPKIPLVETARVVGGQLGFNDRLQTKHKLADLRRARISKAKEEAPRIRRALVGHKPLMAEAKIVNKALFAPILHDFTAEELKEVRSAVSEALWPRTKWLAGRTATLHVACRE